MDPKNSVTLHGLRFRLHIPASEIHPAIHRLARRINADFQDAVRPLLLIALNGAVVFGGELLRQLEGEFEIAFVKLSSYGKQLTSSGEVAVEVPFTVDVRGRDVLIAEDIVDTGKTIRKLDAMLRQAGARSVETATLLLKPEVYYQTPDPLPVKYVALETENRFIVGYGLDFNGLGRNLGAIYALDEEIKA